MSYGLMRHYGLIFRAQQDIVRKAVDGLIAEGYLVCVNFERGHAEHEIADSTDVEAILKAMQYVDDESKTRWAVDDCHLIVHHPDKRSGWVYLIFCNQDLYLISDYTVNLESALKAANDFAEELTNV